MYLQEPTSPCTLLGLRPEDSPRLPWLLTRRAPEAGGLLGGGDLSSPLSESVGKAFGLAGPEVSSALDLGTRCPALPTIKATVVEVRLG